MDTLSRDALRCYRFDSLREITASLQADARKLKHLGICNISARSTLSDANKRRPQAIFADIYRDLYARYKPMLSSDSRGQPKDPQWMKRLQIVDSTTMTLFSNLIFKGVCRHPRRGKKKGGIKVHRMIHANEGVPSDIRFTSAATHDSFMLCPCSLAQGAIIAIDRAYNAKFEQMTQRGITYVTKMKTELNYEVLKDESIQTPEGLMQVRIQDVVLSKKVKAGEAIEHRARIVTYPDENKKKLISLLTNDFDLDPLDIIEVYRKRWALELLFKQIKQHFPLKYFYGESANAIQIQIWSTLIANLLLMVLKRQLKRSWSFLV